jgi:drug/metabolite transporter (DMT)-like permease
MRIFALNRHRGILSALGSALLFGASTPLAKLAVSSADPLLIAGLLYLGSGIGLAISRAILAGPPTERTETPLSRADLPWLADATLAGGVAGPALLLLSTNTFTITTSITSTNILPSTRQANPTRTAISTRAWRIPTHTTPTSIIVTITKP